MRKIIGAVRASMATVLLLITANLLIAQESVTQETNPPSLRWYQVNTPHFRLLYPKGFETQAQRMANTLEVIHAPESKTMGVRPAKISIILQNQSSLSNAFVTLAPRRAEFYAMPSQNYNFLGNNDWLDLLASHEYRHVVQFQRSITGFNKFVYTLFGQQALAGFSFAAAPEWFWEGDAVATETAFTHSGRGRIPNFDLVFRTNLLEGRTFNYHKQYLRSYKHNIPNHYVLGYHMISYLRKKTNDPMVWEKIAGRAWNVPFIPFTFSNSIKKQSGLYITGLYREMATELTTKWKNEQAQLSFTSFSPVNTRKSTAYTDYLYPQVLEDGSILVQKSGIGDIEQLTRIKEGKEVKVYVQGFMNPSGMMSCANDRIVWNEYRYDPRWLVRNYSVVKGYDFKTGKSIDISTQSRYAGAALSPDGNRVVTIETGTDYQSRLVILDYATGQVIKELPNPGNEYISMPHWMANGREIIALKSDKTGKSISIFDAESGISRDILMAGNENIGYPTPFGNYIFYNSPVSGIDNIYVLNSKTLKRYQITTSRYAAYNPVISTDGKWLYYNEQTRDGMDVVKAPFDSTSWKPFETITTSTGFYQHLVDQEGRPGLLDSIPKQNYPVSRYHRASGMFNPHSWGPYLSDFNIAQPRFGITSQDILSTTSLNAGYQYDINEKTGSLQAGVSYQGFYPILDFQVLSGNREYKRTIGSSDVKMDWKEVGTTAGFRIPLVLTRSKYLSQIEFGNTFGLTNVSSFRNVVTRGSSLINNDNQRFVPISVSVNGIATDLDYLVSERTNDGNLLSNYFQVNWIHYLKQSRRDFNPKFGQNLAFEHYSTPYGGDFNGRLWVARGIAFFPGLIKHHSLFFRGGYQNSLSSFNTNTYSFRNQVFKPRGYTYPLDNIFYSVSGNYKLPVWYPDIAIGPILNVQRVKANLFYDYGHGEGTNYFYDFPNNRLYPTTSARNYMSTGVEVTFDINVFRLLQQVEVGFRATHIAANSDNNAGMVYQFLIGNIPF